MQPSLGIMALYMNAKKQFEEREYFKQLIRAGSKLGMRVFLFSPEDVDHKRRRIYCHDYDLAKKVWVRRWEAFPDVIFDRCRFQRHPRFRTLKAFRARYPNLKYLNRPLANKLVIYERLHKNPSIARHLPESQKLASATELLGFIDKHQMIYFKPINGTGGRGILRIEKKNKDYYRVEGRKQNRSIVPPQLFHRSRLFKRLTTWNNSLVYMAQQGIELRFKNQRVHDYRLLMQKDGNGRWVPTGCAGRVGAKRSVTSNLHGGGKAVQMDRLMQVWFQKPEQREQIRRTMYQLGTLVVNELEKHYHEMCELALDIAIDRSGHPWLLEINPKPAREVFHRIGEKKIYQQALVRPLEYALWLHRQSKP